ncbi:MAG: nucleotidyltransferase [Eubacteriales bacterium]|nr:nucleotidyltransferase [Eubacteriales bacterium]
MGRKSIDLEKLAAGLDISPSMHKYAVDRYKGIATFLEGKGIKAEFSPQGSFRTGTVTRPMKNGIETDFDIDVVCTLVYDKSKITAEEVKKLVGEALESDETYRKKMLPEDDRCWTLVYADLAEGIGLKLDVVPGVHEDNDGILRLVIASVDYKYAKSAMVITDRVDKDYYKWLGSNPEGFGLWFDEINDPFLKAVAREQKEAIFKNYRNIFELSASVDDVPDYYVKSPLQRVIQLLKRHRDLYYYRNKAFSTYRPASVIITSLAAKIAENAPVHTLEDLLPYVVNGIADYSTLLQGNSPVARYTGEHRNFIYKKDNRWYIPNPVDPADNYADSWDDNTARAFFEWTSAVKRDLSDTSCLNEMKYLTGLQTSLGKNYVESRLTPSKQASSIVQPQKITQPSKPWGVNEVL